MAESDIQNRSMNRIANGLELLRTERFSDALAVANQLLETNNPSPEVLLFASEVHFQRAGFYDSERLARQCMVNFPDDPGGPALCGRALYSIGKTDEARALALSVAGREFENSHHLGIIISVLQWIHEPEAAYPLARQATRRNPGDATAHNLLALVCRVLGKLDEALIAANAAIKLDSHDYEMIQLRSALEKITPENEHRAELEALLSGGCRDWNGAVKVAYALAKEHEDLGDYSKSFVALQAGASVRRQNFNYAPEEDLEMFETLQQTFTSEAMRRAAKGFESDEPIFVLGLPRTGSTLIERIISSHSAVFSAGELNNFSGAMMDEIRKGGQFADRSDLVRKSLDLDMAAVGRGYIDKTRPFTGHTAKFIDKLPSNFLYIPLIHLALPGASIVHVRRTPLDACYAIYKYLFNIAYPWSYDLDDIAAYYIGYRRLMDHWRAVLPGRIIDIAYEDLVEDLEGEVRGLIEKLGLDWEPACLEFEKNAAAALTGSATQVRQKIYSSSVGRWKDYEAQLKPLADKLEAAGIDPYNP